MTHGREGWLVVSPGSLDSRQGLTDGSPLGPALLYFVNLLFTSQGTVLHQTLVMDSLATPWMLAEELRDSTLCGPWPGPLASSDGGC